MKNYFNGSPFTPAQGHLVLKRIHGGEDDQKMLQQMGGFGVQVLPAGVTPYLQRWHEAHRAWQDNHPHSSLDRWNDEEEPAGTGSPSRNLA